MRKNAPLIDNLLNFFKASEKIGHRDALIWLMCLLEQAGTTDIRVDANLLELSTIGCIGSTSLYTLTHHLREAMTKRAVRRRMHRRSRYQIFDKDTVFWPDSLHRFCDLILNPFPQLHQYFLNLVPWCNADAHSEATGLRNHIGGKPTIDNCTIENRRGGLW